MRSRFETAEGLVLHLRPRGAPAGFITPTLVAALPNHGGKL